MCIDSYTRPLNPPILGDLEGGSGRNVWRFIFFRHPLSLIEVSYLVVEVRLLT
jgi:hypothetical protein